MNTETFFNDIWCQALSILELKGWELCVKEIENICYSTIPKSEINSVKYIPDLVMGTLYQKFGKLNDAQLIFEKLKNIDNAFIRYESRLILGKIYSQMGNFADAYHELKYLADNPNLFNKDNYSLNQSIFWRLGFLSFFENKTCESIKWYSEHQERSQVAHSSQMANNYIFKNLNQLLSGSFDIFKIHEYNLVSFGNYINDGLSVENDVKFVSIAKSIIVPMMLEGFIFLKLQQNLQALTQLLLCRRLLIYENLNINSEGISEALSCVKKMENGALIYNIITFSLKDQQTYRKFLNKTYGDFLVNIAINDANEKFKDFTHFNIYGSLCVAEKLHLTANVSKKEEYVIFIWDGTKSKGLELRTFLKEKLNFNIYSIDDVEFAGLTATDKINRMCRYAKYAIVHHTKNTSFYVGHIKTKLDGARIVELTNENDNYIKNLGVSSITIPKKEISLIFTKIRNCIGK
ncbi:MAG: hypothetical protein FWG98_13270 [Candidatus Cloacimonetes bacterium]|nr:hypothetical protein [Candidatus Cloacimonadota bacterium]